MQAYYSTYNMNLGNIHIYLDSDEDIRLFNSVLKEIVLLLKHHSYENTYPINAE